MPLGVQGNSARYINHSCEPNCTAQNVEDTRGVRHVCIYTGDRGVKKGEELTYDYGVSHGAAS